jgi:SAM-dependent methyltransferase
VGTINNKPKKLMLDHEYETMRQVEDAHWWYRCLRGQVLGDVIAWRGKEPSLTLLDAGCGTGGMLDTLREQAPAEWRLQGVDRSPLAVEFCHGRGLERVVEGDVQALPQADGSCDVVLSLDVIVCGAVNDAVAVAEGVRVLRPGGLMVVNCAAYDFLRGRHDDAVDAVRRYDPARLRRLLEDAGLQILTLHAWNIWVFPWLAIWRFASRHRPAAPGQLVRSDLFRLPGWLERLLTGVARLDFWLARRLNCRWGTSMYALAIKPQLPRADFSHE